MIKMGKRYSSSKKVEVKKKNGKIKTIKFTKREKTLLEILIHEIQETLTFCEPECYDKINTILHSWIKANDLHPEQCITVRPTEKELKEFHEKFGR